MSEAGMGRKRYRKLCGLRLRQAPLPGFLAATLPPTLTSGLKRCKTRIIKL